MQKEHEPHGQRMFPMPSLEERREKRLAKKKLRPWWVQYCLAYDGGGSTWIGYYRTKTGAYISAFINVHIKSWGGTAYLFQRAEGIWL
jgi:hypothetical protein